VHQPRRDDETVTPLLALIGGYAPPNSTLTVVPPILPLVMKPDASETEEPQGSEQACPKATFPESTSRSATVT
jgi:hypothetical protein